MIAYAKNGYEVWWAKRIAEGQWSKELVDSKVYVWRRISLKFDADKLPVLVYSDQYLTHEL